MTRIGVVDYQIGNLRSVANAFVYLGVDWFPVRSATEVSQASHVVLPGVGAFAAGMRKLESLGLVPALRQHAVGAGKPLLGICLGMQLLADVGNEFESVRGLGLIPGRVDKVSTFDSGLPLPHIGWNDLVMARDSPLFDGADPTPCCYFAHSFQLLPDDRDAVVATCRYGGEVIAAAQRDNVFGVQFHPEKSQTDGLRLLKNFATIKTERTHHV